MKYVISLFDKTGNMVKPWIESGYGAYIVDIQHQSGEVTEGALTRCGADIFEWVPPRWLCKADIVSLFAFPPCTHLAVSGARWFKGKGLGLLADSIRMFERSAYWAEWFGVPYMIENPVSTISSY